MTNSPNTKPRDFASLDIYAIVLELQSLAGARVKKIYQLKDTFYFSLHQKEKKTLVIGPKFLYLTNYTQKYPVTPSSFCMFLRKHLANSKITKIEQHKFDRVVEIHFSGKEDKILVAEFFGDGNLILLDENRKIINPLHRQTWRHRTVKKGESYVFPPESPDPRELSPEGLGEIFNSSSRDIVRTMAIDLGFGGTYADEICLRAGIDKNIPAQETPKSALNDFTRIFRALFEEIKANPAPIITTEAGKFADFLPIAIEKYQDSEKKPFKTFNEVCDEFFTEDKITKIITETSAKKEELERILKEQEETFKKLEKEVVEFQKLGDKLSQEHKFKESAEYYSKSKKAKNKLPGLIKALKSTRKKLEKEELSPKTQMLPEKTPKIKKKWFEKFRWFISSDHFLVIGGKDATTNEIIIKKHTEPKDIVFHADITGAPFCVIKAEGREVPKTTIEETAQFAASYSKAWQLGLGAVDVYSVKPEQVSKEAPAGEYLGKGAFMIKGKKNYFRNTKLLLAISFEGNTVIAGPENAIKSRSEQVVLIIPGHEKSGELAKKIREKLGKDLKLDDIQRFIPAGKGRILK